MPGEDGQVLLKQKIPKTNTKSQNPKNKKQNRKSQKQETKSQNPKNKKQNKKIQKYVEWQGVVGSRGPQGTVGTPPPKLKKLAGGG